MLFVRLRRMAEKDELVAAPSLRDHPADAPSPLRSVVPRAVPYMTGPKEPDHFVLIPLTLRVLFVRLRRMAGRVVRECEL